MSKSSVAALLILLGLAGLGAFAFCAPASPAPESRPREHAAREDQNETSTTPLRQRVEDDPGRQEQDPLTTVDESQDAGWTPEKRAIWSADNGVGALSELLEGVDSERKRHSAVLRAETPSIEHLLSDKDVNRSELELTQEERQRLEAAIRPHEETIAEALLDFERRQYASTLDRIRSGNEISVSGESRDSVAQELRGLDSTTVIATSFSLSPQRGSLDLSKDGRMAAWQAIQDRYRGQQYVTFGTGGRGPGTARYTVFVLGDGSGVLETKALVDQVKQQRVEAVRAFLTNLRR